MVDNNIAYYFIDCEKAIIRISSRPAMGLDAINMAPPWAEDTWNKEVVRRILHWKRWLEKEYPDLFTVFLDDEGSPRYYEVDYHITEVPPPKDLMEQGSRVRSCYVAGEAPSMGPKLNWDEVVVSDIPTRLPPATAVQDPAKPNTSSDWEHLVNATILLADESESVRAVVRWLYSDDARTWIEGLARRLIISHFDSRADAALAIAQLSIGRDDEVVDKAFTHCAFESYADIPALFELFDIDDANLDNVLNTLNS